MNCKYCDAFLEEGVNVCPACGKEQIETAAPEAELCECEETCACEETCQCEESCTCEETCQCEEGCTCECDETCEVEEAVAWEMPPEAPAKKNRTLLILLTAIGCVVLLGVLVFALLKSMGVTIKLPANDVFRKDTYMAEEADASKSSDTVVATLNGRELTNGELQIYFWTQVYDFVDYYGTSYFDPYEPLSQQVMDTQTGKTWEQYFLEIALQTWQRYATLRNMAEAANFTPTQEMTEYLTNLPEQMAAAAEQYGFASADELIKGDMGPAASFDAYAAYMENYCIGLDYFDVLYQEMSPSDAEIEEYFTAHEATLKESGITKESGLKSDVRHILVIPDSESESTTYTDEEWAAALKEAEDILAQWKAGDATEESFTKLAQEHSEDPGVTTNSGLYQAITATASYLEEFRAWAVDPSRKEGDTGIVKTSAGYHIMYFVTGEAEWISACRNALVSEKASSALDAEIEKNPMEVNYKKLVLGNALADEIEEHNATTPATNPTEGTAAPTEEAVAPSATE